MPETEITLSPTPPLLAAELKRLGFKEVVPVPGAPAWWGTDDPKAGALPWEQRIVGVTDELLALRSANTKMLASRPKNFALTSEFWLSLGATAPMVIGAVEMLKGNVTMLPPPWGMVAGTIMALVSASIPIAYAVVRAKAKAAAEAEKQKVITEITTKEGPTP